MPDLTPEGLSTLGDSLRRGFITTTGKHFRKRCPVLRKTNEKKKKMTCVKVLKNHPPLWSKHI